MHTYICIYAHSILYILVVLLLIVIIINNSNSNDDTSDNETMIMMSLRHGARPPQLRRPEGRAPPGARLGNGS